MRRLLLVLLLLAFVPGVAQAAPPIVPPGLASFSWTETVYTPSGKVITHRSGVGNHVGDVGADPAHPPKPTSPGDTPRRLQSFSGCADYAGYVASWTALGFLAYEFEHGAHVCWSNSHLTQFVPHAYLRYSDGQHQLASVSSFGYYYQWPTTSCCADGGHRSYRQGTVTNCVFRYGCIGSELPWVDLYVVANGAWSVYGGK